MIPGLCQLHLRGGWLPSLREFIPQQTARLVCSFPATITVTETTILTGNPPLLHGVLFPGEESRLSGLIAGQHSRLDTILDATDPATAFARLDAELREILSGLAPGDLLLVSGAPSGQEYARRVQLDTEGLEEAGFSLHADDAFSLCAPNRKSTPLPDPLIQRWLDCPGVERVLCPTLESAGGWMAPDDRGWLIVAEPGFSFSEHSPTFGHREPTVGADSVLLAWGPTWAEDWPESVHDWRIAPTLLAASGESLAGCFDRPLPASDTLGC
jgi:hypothetical protein